MAKRLSDTEITQQLNTLNQTSPIVWQIRENQLHLEYRFDSFLDAIHFFSQAAPVIQAMDHHPQWSNCYNQVVIDLTTHSAGGLTHLDFDLAKQLNPLILKNSITQ